MFNHRKYLMACYDHSYLFKRRRKKGYWFSKSLTAQQRGTYSEHSNPPRISKAQRRAAAAAARLKDIEAEEKYLDKSGEDEEFVRRERKRLQRDLAQIAPVKLGGGSLAYNQGVAPEGWDSVAGLQDVVQCLKEMVTLPLLYPEAFTRSLSFNHFCNCKGIYLCSCLFENWSFLMIVIGLCLRLSITALLIINFFGRTYLNPEPIVNKLDQHGLMSICCSYLLSDEIAVLVIL